MEPTGIKPVTSCLQTLACFREAVRAASVTATDRSMRVAQVGQRAGRKVGSR
jgi:hypothetical protein